MWEHARYLASAGHDVTFVASSHAGAAKEETLDGVKVVRIGGLHSLWLRTFTYYMTRARGRFDVVVVEGFGGSRIPRLAPLYVTEPMITEWHQIHRELFAIQYPKLLNAPLNVLERVTARVHRNTFVRAGTEEWREPFAGIGFRPENIFVLPVSIHEDWLRDLPRHDAPRPTVLWLGKLRRYKCPDHAIRAMVQVVERVPDAQLVIAIRRDDRRYEDELRQLVSELHLDGHVEFRLNISEEEKRELLQSVHALVVPSAVEGFGIVVLEANACGVPVVASSGVPEGAVKDHFNGLRYEFGNIDQLSSRLVELLSDDALRSELGANGRSFAKRFAWAEVGAQFEAIVEKLAQQRKVAAPASRESIR